MPTAKISNNKEFELLPEGRYNGVLADVTLKKDVPVTWQGKTKLVDKIGLVYILDVNDSTGVPFRAFQSFNNSDVLHPQSRLGPAIAKLLKGTGIPLTSGMELDVVIGTQAELTIEHTEGKDRNGKPKTFANVSFLQVNPKGTVKIPADFKRQKDRPAKQPYNQQQTESAVQQTAAEDDAGF